MRSRSEIFASAVTAQLKTSLANNPLFFANRCTYDSQAWSYTCSQVTSGTFDVTWKENGIMSSDSQGTSSTSFKWYAGSYTKRTTGQMSSDSADVSGTVFGNQVGGAGTIGRSKNNTVSRDIFKDTSGGGGDGGGGIDAGPG